MAYHPNLDPELRAGIEQSPLPASDLSNLSIEQLDGFRAQINAFLAAAPPAETDVVIEDRQVPGPDGAPDIRVRIYRPPGEAENRPGLYWIHGGGMILGTPE